MRREPDFFDEQDLDLVYVAKKLKEALRLEEVLTAAGFDYLVEPDRYSGGIIFRTERVGAFFERQGFTAVGHDEVPDEKWQGYDPDRKARVRCFRLDL